MTKHTPGPWAATTRQGSWDWVVFQATNPNMEICQMFHDGTDENETGAANARLIAAAPETAAERDRLREINAELLAALKELSDGMWAGDGISNPAVPGHQVAKARAAIARAEGEDQ